MNGIVLLISFSASSLLVHRKATGFCLLVLCPATLLKVFVRSELSVRVLNSSGLYHEGMLNFVKGFCYNYFDDCVISVLGSIYVLYYVY
jgi:hypothetical protein